MQMLPFKQQWPCLGSSACLERPLGHREGPDGEESSSFPTKFICRGAEDLLTSTTGLDEKELGLPSQAGAASSVEDVHNFLDGHRKPVCAINSPRELEVAGLEDQESWLQNQGHG